MEMEHPLDSDRRNDMHTHSPTTGMQAARSDQVVGKRPPPGYQPDETPDGPGLPTEPEEGRPTTTGTPGGALGAPTEKELKEDPEAESEKSR